MPIMNPGASLGACALVLALSAAPAVFAQSDVASTPTPTDASAQAISTPRYLLMAPNGRSVTSEDFRGRLQLISFGFTSCPDVCPTTLLEMTHLLTALGAKAQYLQPIFITVDPQRDTAQVLGAYTAAFDARILGLTGPPALVQRAATNFKVRSEKIQEPGASPDVYTMDHSTGMFLLDPDGNLVAKFGYGAPVAEITERIQYWLTVAGK
jgi:protein SCO1/2